MITLIGKFDGKDYVVTHNLDNGTVIRTRYFSTKEEASEFYAFSRQTVIWQ